MTDITDRLAELGRRSEELPTTATFDQDIARGQRALRRRRARMGSAVAVLALGVAGGATALSVGRPTAPKAAEPAVRHPAASSPVRPTKVDLVDYTGQQPDGFRFGSIPEGYQLDLQASTAGEVLIAPIADQNSDPDSFIGKLVVTAEAASEYGGLSSLGDSSISVGSDPGRLGDDGTATQVWWQVGSTIIDVQCWDSIGLTHAQLVDFAGSVSLTSQIQLSHG